MFNSLFFIYLLCVDGTTLIKIIDAASERYKTNISRSQGSTSKDTLSRSQDADYDWPIAYRLTT